MGRRAITEDVWQDLVDGWRQNPHSASAAARYAGTTAKTAQKAWENGFPQKGWIPVKIIMEQEKVKARAMLLAEEAARTAVQQKEREDAIKQAAQTRVQEGQIVQVLRGTSLAAVSEGAQLASAARQLAAWVQAQMKLILDSIANGSTTAEAAGLTVEKALARLDRISVIMERIARFALTAMQAERLHMGEPMEIVKLHGADVEMTLEEAELRLEAAQAALSDAREYGGLRIIDGGLSAPQLGVRVGA